MHMEIATAVFSVRLVVFLLFKKNKLKRKLITVENDHEITEIIFVKLIATIVFTILLARSSAVNLLSFMFSKQPMDSQHILILHSHKYRTQCFIRRLDLANTVRNKC